MVKQAYEAIKQELGFLPGPSTNRELPYVPVRLDGDVAYVSGNIAFSGGNVMHAGRIGDTISAEEGRKSAALAALNCLELLDGSIGLEHVDRILKVTGYLCCAESFTEQPTVMNSGSEVFVRVFGENGKHARAAIGVHTLPLGASVEIELIAKLKPRR